MPPQLALLLSFALTIWLIKADRVSRPEMTFASWIVLLWLMIRASRPVTAWIGGSIGAGGGSELDGNATEAAVMMIFFVSAIIILSRRGFRFGSIPGLNIFFSILVIYLGLSCLWSYMPFVSFKRWFKEVGTIFIALVLVTDHRPGDTLRSICIRCSYLLFPLSIAFIKYFPHLGRAYSVSGEPMVTGVTDQKNSLGLICCIFSLTLIWDISEAYRERGIKPFSKTMRPQLITLCIGAWLLWESQSKTSLVALIFGVVIFYATLIPVARRSPKTFALSAFAAISVAIAVIGASTVIAAPLLEAMGRDATLTGRTEIWKAALDQPTNIFVGSGFYIFWNEFGPTVWSYFQGNFFVRSAHSGYIEMYLDGGLIGCFLLGVYLLSLGHRLGQQYNHSNGFSRFAFSIFIILIITNFSEVYIFRMGSLWFIIIVFSLMNPHLGFKHSCERNPIQSTFDPKTGTANINSHSVSYGNN